MVEFACTLIIGWILLKILGFILDVFTSAATTLLDPKKRRKYPDERDELLFETLILKKLSDENHYVNR